MSKVTNIIQNKVVKNAGWLIMGKIIQMVLNLVVSLLTARYLGPGNYGLINYGAAYTAFFSAFCTLGINSLLVKEFVDYPGEEGKILGTALGMRALSSVLSAITIIAISFVVDRGEPLTQIIVALCSVGVIFHIFEIFNYWFQYRLESKKTAVATLIAYAVTAAYRIFLLATNQSVAFFALATSVDYFCVAVILLLQYFRGNHKKLFFSWTYGKSLLRKSCHYILPSLMVSVYSYTDKIMLKQIVGDAELGFYSTAAALSSVWCFVLSAIIDSMYPVIMQTHKTDKTKYRYLNKVLYAIIFYLSSFVAICFIVMGENVINIMYGDKFIPAAEPLKIITCYTAFIYLDHARNAWVICENKLKYLKFFYIAAAVINVIMNAFLIPIIGANGAAIASLLAQFISVFAVPLLLKDMRENSIMMIEAIFLRGIIKKKQ